MGPLQVVLFGGFQLRRGAASVPPIPSRAARSLLAYLVMEPGIHHPRERLAAAFWPDLAAGRARRRLSHTLWQVQDALGELTGGITYLDVAPDTLAFSTQAAVRVDVHAFEEGLDRARVRRGEGSIRIRDLTDLEATVELYRGEFLSGHYDSWIAPVQERLHQRYLEALGWLVGLAKAHAAHDDALLYARRLTNEDPLREDGHREVMRLSVLLGRTGDAIRQYERCREVLADELGTAPSPVTDELYQRLLRTRRLPPAAAAPDPASFPDRPPLIGRDREREVAVTVLERALAGRGGTILVEGEPGIGTTRLLAEVVDDAHWRAFATAQATCHRTDGGAAYVVIQDVLESVLTPLRAEQLRHRVAPVWLAAAAGLLPVLARALPPSRSPEGGLRDVEGAHRLQAALVHVLCALAEIDPLLVVVDDLQWCDPASLEVFAAAAGELAPRRLVLAVGYQGDEARVDESVWPAIRAIDRRGRPERILLAPLDAFSTGELTRVLLRGQFVSSAAVSRLHRATGGNPLFLVETLRTLSEEQLFAVLEEDDAVQLPLPGGIRALLLARLERLPSEAREVLDVVALAGEGLELDALVDACELPREVVVDAADLLVRRGLLGQPADGLQVPHDQVRRATTESLAASHRQDVHRRLAEALAVSAPDAVERLAHHFAEAGAPQAAARYLQLAGRNATKVHAYAIADGFYRRAIQQRSLAPTSVERRFELLAEHEAILDVVGDRDAQRVTLRELAVLADGAPAREIDVACRSALLSGHLGDLEVAVRTAARAVDGAEDQPEARLLCRALIAQASVLAWAGRRAEAVPVLERAIDVASSPALEVQVRAQLGSVLRELQRYDAAVEQLDVVLRTAGELGELREETVALGVLGTIRMETGDSAAALDLYGRAIHRCEAIGFRRGEGVNRVNRATAHAHRGEVRAALDDYAHAAGVFVALGDRRGEAMVRLNQAFLRHAVLGEDDHAREEVATALGFLQEVGDDRFVGLCQDTLASIELRAGRLDRASQHVETALATAERGGDDWVMTQALHRRAAIALADGAYERAAADAEAALVVARRQDLRDLLPVLRGLQGEILVASGELDAALVATTDAVAGLHAGVDRGYLVWFQHHLAARATSEFGLARTAGTRAHAELERVLGTLTPDERERAMRVPEHQRIADAVHALAADAREATVASAFASLGKRLGADELVVVRVHLDAGRETPAGGPERRRWFLEQAIAQVRAQGGAPTVRDLADILDVSEATVRRDLQALRMAGAGVETRGTRLG